MRIGTGIALLVVGLVLVFALDVNIPGFNDNILGWILAVGGALAIVLTLYTDTAKRRHTTQVVTTDAEGRQSVTERRTETTPPPSI